MTMHLENFVAVRQLLPRMTFTRTPRSGLAIDTNNAQYQQLLSEANLNYNMREYTVALDAYLSLREKILIQSHPELPATSGIGVVLGDAVRKIDPSRVVELSRQILLNLPPGNPVTVAAAVHAVVLPVAQPNPAFSRFGAVQLDAVLASKGVPEAAGLARQLVSAGALDAAIDTYQTAADAALAKGDLRSAADLTAEKAAMRATYASGTDRAQALATASTEFRVAAGLYSGLGDDAARNAMVTNLAAVERDTGQTAAVNNDVTRPIGIADPAGAAGVHAVLAASVLRINAATTQQYLAPTSLGWDNAQTVAGNTAPARPTDRTIGWYVAGQVAQTSLDPTVFTTTLIQKVYQPRITATTLEGIDFLPQIDPNFVAYLLHLYFYVLPVSIGDTYVALGRYADALVEYRAALGYQYLNTALEAPNLWQKMAGTYLTWGKELFRQADTAGAQAQLQVIIGADLTIPSASELYSSAPFAAMTAAVGDVVHQIKGEPFGDINPMVATIIVDAVLQLKRIAAGLDFFGIGPNTYPIFRFQYLQNAANFLADAAVQAERTFMQFRSTAEQQKLDRMQLQANVQLNQTALSIEQAHMVEAQDELTIAQEGQKYTADVAAHAQDALNDWNTLGYEASRQDWYLTWAANAQNDQSITFTNALYEGERHDFNDVPARDFIETIAKRRDEINWEMQRNRLQNQIEEAADEKEMADSRVTEAGDRIETQQLSITLASQRLASSAEALDYTRDRMFNEDLWFRLAAELQDLSRAYLDSAIYTARLAERAYQIEFDRPVSFIRTDYGIGGVEGLLGGDYLKRDLTQFTIDSLQTRTKTNPVRLVLSMRNEFPAQFNVFRQTGILPFTTDLELFDRPFPGTFRRKIKKLEIFVEGLLPPEGIAGYLVHQGLCKEWRVTDGTWAKQTWAVPSERMVLSSYEFRRDLSIFQPSEEVTGLFEDYAPQGNWMLTIPRSANNVDYQAITDIQLAVYLTADYDETLAAHIATVYPNTGGRVAVLSSRFYFPDEYFRLDADRKVTFTIDATRFPYNYDALTIDGFAITVLDRSGVGMPGISITVTRGSDSSTVTGVTDSTGALAGDQTTLAPYAAWKGATPVDAFTVAFAAGVDTTTIGDVQLALGYAYTYRADGTLTA